MTHSLEKLESIGRLAGGIAHDFNNLLTTMRGYASLVLMDTPEDDPRRKPFDLDDVVVRVERALERRRLILESRDYQRNLEKKVAEQTEEIRRLSLGAIQSLIAALEAKDPYTCGHSEGVTEIALSLGLALGLPEGKTEKLRLAALLHDIGKIGVQDSILHKPSSLTDEEYARVMNHPVVGEAILRPIVRDEEVLGIIRHHHEHYDGSGYPDGLKGNGIPLGARILAVADVYQAMTGSLAGGGDG